jgi:hypothetical protein
MKMRAMIEGNLPPRKALEKPLLYAREDVKLGGVSTKRGRDAERKHRSRVRQTEVSQQDLPWNFTCVGDKKEPRTRAIYLPFG